MVARTVPLRCWWCARTPFDRQQRFPPNACAIVAVNSWRPVFFQCWPNVLRGAAMFRACLKRMTRASILYVVCVKIINMWLGMLSARSASRLFRSFFQCSMFVRWHMFVSFGTFDFGGNGAREEKQNNTLAHVMWKGFIWRCRRTLIFVSSITYSKHS